MSALVGTHQQILSSHTDNEGRFANVETISTVERMLHNSLHLSGDYACSKTENAINIINNGVDKYWLDLFNRPRQVYASDSTDAQRIRNLGTTAGARAKGSDVIVALMAQPPVSVISHDAIAGNFELAHDDDFMRGSFAIVCNQQLAVLFQVTKVSLAGRRIAYIGGGVSPGNCTDIFDVITPCGTENNYVFNDNALAAVLYPVVLFVGINQTAQHRSLYRERLTITSGSVARAYMRREEMIEGVNVLRARLMPGKALDIGIIVTGGYIDTATPSPMYLFGDNLSADVSDPALFYLSHEFTVAF